MLPPYRSTYPQSPPRAHSPALSAVGSPPHSPPPPYLPTVLPVPSSPSSTSTTGVVSPPSTPSLANALRASQPSPDFLEDFEFTQEMYDAAQMIESLDIQRRQRGLPPISLDNGVPVVNSTPPPTQNREEKAWVVFHGSIPGIYPDSVTAAMQTIGQRDGYQRVYPDRASAEAVFNRFENEGIYPDYGKAPWVVFLGRKVGVITKITELESSVKGFSGALFHSCSGRSEAKLEFERFSQTVTNMFADSPDPFAAVDGLTPRQGGDIFTDPPVSTPSPAPTPQPIAGPSTSRSSRTGKAVDYGIPALVFPPHHVHSTGTPNPNQGWFVAFNAVIPGVYYGVEALKAARPQPGGYRCAVNEEVAHIIFHEYMWNDMLVFAPSEE